MYWYDNLYTSDNLSKNIKVIRMSVEHKFNIKPIYLIVLSDMADGQPCVCHFVRKRIIVSLVLPRGAITQEAW